LQPQLGQNQLQGGSNNSVLLSVSKCYLVTMQNVYSPGTVNSMTFHTTPTQVAVTHIISYLTV